MGSREGHAANPEGGSPRKEMTLEEAIKAQKRQYISARRNGPERESVFVKLLEEQKRVQSIDQRRIYKYPGPVKNAELIVPGQSMNLRENLLEFHDYVALPNSLWRCIYAWYGADYSIERYLVARVCECARV